MTVAVTSSGLKNKVIQTAYFSTITTQTCTTVTPEDNTVPTQAETQIVMTTPSFTPLDGTSVLLIQYSGFGVNIGGSRTNVVLFQDAGSALQCDFFGFGSGNFYAGFNSFHQVASAGVTARVFKVGIGTAAGTFHFLSNSGSHMWGAAGNGQIMIQEILP